jgi:Protein of unknown function (DUF2726)
MLSSFVSALIVTASLSAFLGAASYRYWALRTAKEKKRIPVKWQLRARPLFTDVERTVWRWLRQVFFDQQLLLKIPVIRFLSPQSAAQGHHSHELLKGIYCSFTVCKPDGSVIGCIDVPGAKGLKASHRDMKQKLFAECGIAYTVLSASNLPTLEGLRASFLGALALVDQPHSEFTVSTQPSVFEIPPTAIAAASQPAQLTAAEHPAESVSGKVQPSADTKDTKDALQSNGVDMVVVAAARSSLQEKLERNRKTRLATIESLSASMGIVDDSADKGFVVTWHDSFVLSEHPESSLKDQ